MSYTGTILFITTDLWFYLYVHGTDRNTGVRVISINHFIVRNISTTVCFIMIIIMY
ncbi:hypothetical protein SAMN05444422_102345 [Halobiforma haloterrestris]|uniref:Uncharacterized protein n=1 Tax=Natronobacterium haloterrestre TaxID=148448 RepID=A0A1I1EHA2_NATHA|nr:hypothetical protein SAMN05444422_102345 [Halobiforma haloterrestris]